MTWRSPGGPSRAAVSAPPPDEPQGPRRPGPLPSLDAAASPHRRRAGGVPIPAFPLRGGGPSGGGGPVCGARVPRVLLSVHLAPTPVGADHSRSHPSGHGAARRDHARRPIHCGAGLQTTRSRALHTDTCMDVLRPSAAARGWAGGGGHGRCGTTYLVSLLTNVRVPRRSGETWAWRSGWSSMPSEQMPTAPRTPCSSCRHGSPLWSRPRPAPGLGPWPGRYADEYRGLDPAC